jgi:ankyrin repeat protein
MFEDGKTSPAHIAATLEDSAMLELLITYRADVDCSNEEGETPLHLAAENGLIENASLILRGAEPDFDAQDNDGETPLHKAIENGHLDIIKLLINAGADATIEDIDGLSPMDDAEDDPEVMSCLLAAIAARDIKKAKEETEPLQREKRQAEDTAEEEAKKAKDDSAYETESRESSDNEEARPAPDAAASAISPAKTLQLFSDPGEVGDVAVLADLDVFGMDLIQG